ncbi:MAG: LuxR family transcriptional regulator [Rhizobacter sp.]|nr:LuxR family transcriptional regulator [Rhizobacter sp.]
MSRPPDMPSAPSLPRTDADVVLIVDDAPDNLSVLHDALDESGYTVLVATNGETALQRALQAQPDIILLDAVMPGMDGFEVARRLKANPDTSAIPIVFMTGLTESEHVVAAFNAGGADYVTKPIRPSEVLARIASHMRNARHAHQARNALDAFGHAMLAVRMADERLVWQTPLARRLLQDHFDSREPQVPARVLGWLAEQATAREAGRESVPLSLIVGSSRVTFVLHEQTSDDDWLVVMRETSDAAVIDAITATFKLTLREAEVLYWVVKGKTSRDIGDILGSSAATVKKHLEHVFAKLGVETRTSAAGLVMSRLGHLIH